MRIVVLVSGTGTLLQALIDNLDQRVEILAVGSDLECPGIARAHRANIDTFIVSYKNAPSRDQWNQDLVDQIKRYNPDYIVSAGFMRILGSPVLAEYSLRIINTHPALLPAFPGAHAVPDALAAGVKVTGSTIHFVDEGVDTGPIIAQRSVEVEDADTQESLHEKIKVQERQQLLNVLYTLADKGYSIHNRKVTPRND